MPEPDPTGDSQETPDDPFGEPDPSEEEEFSAEIEQTEEINGTFPVKLVDIRTLESNAGNPMWVWDFVITEGPYAGEEVPQFTVLTPNARWKLSETVRALGLAQEGEEEVNFKKSEAIGLLAHAEISHDPEYGNSVDTVKPHAKGRGVKATGGPMDPAEEQAESAPDVPEGGDEADDDLPF